MRNKAFTLIELVVAFTVMAVIMSAIMQSLQAFVTTSRKLSIVRETQKDLSFAMLRMGDKIRNNPIDYDAFTGHCSSSVPQDPPITTDEICLRNGWGFEFDLGNEQLYILKKSPSQPTEKSPLFPANIKVRTATFEVSPHKDPEDHENWGDKAVQRQPRVDIVLEIESTRDPDVRFSIDTSFSSRVY